ncbi:TPA: hypothetical protein R5S02_003191 [Salmonella enterica]|nr:hypothetical protein [Salmonella enterica]
MKNTSVANTIEQVDKIISAVFENSKLDKDTETHLFNAMSLLATARESASHAEISSRSITDAVSDAMVNINRICVAGTHYLESCFDDDDNDDENCIMFGLLTDLANDAHRYLKVAETQLL